MRNTVLFNIYQLLLSTIQGAKQFITIALIGLVIMTGCGSNNDALQLPEDFIRDFIAKHETMIDQSLVYYYVREEQPGIAEKVGTAVRFNAAKGALEILEQATFDFSGLRIEHVDRKEEYVNDEPVIFVKVAVKGNYTMVLPKTKKRIDANEIIILQMAHNEWKITESNNPWG